MDDGFGEIVEIESETNLEDNIVESDEESGNEKGKEVNAN